jgi:hypothetical protein
MSEPLEDIERWQSWVDPDAKPERWNYNLFREMIELLHRRDSWRGFVEMVQASPDNAQAPASAFVRWVARSYIETQAIAIRRIARRTNDPRPVSLVRVLDEIAHNPVVLSGIEARQIGEDAQSDADQIHDAAERVATFASQQVAHFDREQSPENEDLTFADLHEVVNRIAAAWERWYLRITGKGILMDVTNVEWWKVLRLRWRSPMIENLEFMAGRAVFDLELTPDQANQLADAVEGNRDVWGAAIGSLWAQPKGREVAEALFEILSNEADTQSRRQLADSLRWVGRLPQKSQG